MSKSTRLYQRARSPLIQGRSKVERPWIVDVARGALFGIPVPYLYALADATASGLSIQDALLALLADTIIVLPVALVASFVGAASGVSVARSWGSRRPWVVGAFCAVIVAFAVWMLLGLGITGPAA
ncbi:MAG: hypothetical protein WBI63_10890 [Coriobacteriia bacterium]